MGLLLRLPLSIPTLSNAPPSLRRTHFPNPFCSTIQWSIKLGRAHPSAGPSLLRSLPKDSNEYLFLDENGVVDDMDGYLNYLSLEYDSVWDTKPSWCQPWTITLTGVMAIAGSWVLVQSVVVTTIALLLICTWWYIFLYEYPKEYAAMIADRRKRVTSGVEDTFGRKRND